jgi:hypothetical protein
LVDQEQKGVEEVNKDPRSMGIRQSRQPHWIFLNRGGCLLWRGLYNFCSAKDNDDDDNDDDDFRYETKEYRIAILLKTRLNLVSQNSISSIWNCCIVCFVLCIYSDL